jgi:hypothetical protein
MQQDMTRRISIVINKELPSWQVLNTVAHISAYFGNLLDEQLTTGEYFESKDGVLYPRNSQYPIIALSAQPNQLQSFAQTVRQANDVSVMYFIREMIETTSDGEIQDWLTNTTSDQVELLGVGIFGENQRVKELTKQFKLWS